MKRLYQILSSRYASLFCILFAFTNRTALAIFASYIGRDKQLQLTMSENLLAGHGFTIIKYFTKDLYTPVYDRSQVFPPGYSIIIIPFLKLFNNDTFFACTALDIISAIAFVIVFRILCKKLSLPVYLINLATIIAGCSQYVFFMDAGSTDVISLNLILIGIVASINIIHGEKKPGFIKILGYSLLFFLPSFFRYMYIVYSPVLPLFILFWGFYFKKNHLKAAGLQLISLVLVLQAVMILWISSQSPESVYPSASGLFPEQLLHWYPFFLASFINIDFAAQRMEQLPGTDYTTAIKIFELINLAAIPVIIAVIRNTLVKRKFNFFSLAGGVLSLLILITLAFLTLTNKSQTHGYTPWNYTNEGRYFAFINVFMVLFFFYFLNTGNWQKHVSVRIPVVAIILILIGETTHGIYFNAKLPFHYNKMRDAVIDETPLKYFDSLLQELKSIYPDAELLVSSPNSYYNNYASAKKIKAIFDPSNLNSQSLNVYQKSLLLVPIEIADLSQLKEYLERKKPKLIRVISNTYFYIEELSPDKP